MTRYRDRNHASACALLFTPGSPPESCTCAVGEVERLRRAAHGESLMMRAGDIAVLERLSAVVPPRPGLFEPVLAPEAFGFKTVPMGEPECEALRRVLAERELRGALLAMTTEERDEARAEVERLRALLTEARELLSPSVPLTHADARAVDNLLRDLDAALEPKP